MDLDLPDNWKEILLWWKNRKKVIIDWRIGPVSTSKKQPVSYESYRKILPIFGKEKESQSMSLIMTTTQECPLEVAFKDAHGNPAPVENIVWSSTSEDIIKVNANDVEPNKAIVVAVGSPGTGQVNVKADPKIGEAVGEIIGVLDVEIAAAEATIVEISAGTPIETPHVEPHGKRRR
jgi:hypothetical protein